MKSLLSVITNLGQLLFNRDISSYILKFRINVAMLIIPRELRAFFDVILVTVNSKYEKLDKSKKDKISGLNIDFEFRD